MKRAWFSRLLFGLTLASGLLARPTLAAEPERRQLPDYDGRPNPTTPGEVALWVPRIVLFPAYVLSEYVIRRPLGFLITAAEKAELPAAIYNIFAFGPDHKAGIVPIAFVDLGFLPSVGLYAFWDDAGVPGHDLRLHGSTWGKEWLVGSVTDRLRLSETRSITFTVAGSHRKDYAFYGIGPNSREGDLSRYGADSVDARAVFREGFWGSSALEGTVGYRSFEFYPGSFGGNPTVDQQVARGVYPEPPGYQDGYGAGVSRLHVTLDSRSDLVRSATGVRFDLLGEEGSSVRKGPPLGWVRYGGALGGFVDLGDRGRVVSLSVAAAFVDPLAREPVPFTELVTLGGPNLMPGYRAGRLNDRSALVTTLRYTWPVWFALKGSLQAAAGNVFGEHLSGFSIPKGRFSGAIGLESTGSRDSIFQLLFGFGTERFENGAQIDSLRLTVGARSGF